jgi:hypothetical protein
MPEQQAAGSPADASGALPDEFRRGREAVAAGLGRIVALHHRSSTSYHIHDQIRRIFF